MNPGCLGFIDHKTTYRKMLALPSFDCVALQRLADFWLERNERGAFLAVFAVLNEMPGRPGFRLEGLNNPDAQKKLAKLIFWTSPGWGNDFSQVQSQIYQRLSDVFFHSAFLGGDARPFRALSEVMTGVPYTQFVTKRSLLKRRSHLKEGPKKVVLLVIKAGAVADAVEKIVKAYRSLFHP